MLGYRYDDSPIIVADGTPATAHDFLNYVPSARPGALAPHAWLHDGSSLYDHFGQGFTLLAIDGPHAADVDRAHDAAAKADVPLKVLRPREPAIATLYQSRYALIRPDQHVAWRGDALPDSIADLLLHVTGHLPSRKGNANALYRF